MVYKINTRNACKLTIHGSISIMNTVRHKINSVPGYVRKNL